MTLSNIPRSLLLLLFVSVPLEAQVANATMNVVVRDGTGAAVAQAKVKVTNDNTGLERTGLANQRGELLVPLLPVGQYSVSAEFAGFKMTTIMSVAPAKGATFWDHLSLVVRRAFLSLISLAERSSPSRVRFAAPNNGAPLTAPGRSELTPPDKRERLIPEGCGHLGARGAKMAPFFTATDIQSRQSCFS
jgi:hypothetical protein